MSASAESMIGELILAIKEQTVSISKLVDINQQLLAALADVDGEEELAPTHYLDGELIGCGE